MLEIIIQKVEAILFTKANYLLNNSEYVYLVYVYTFICKVKIQRAGDTKHIEIDEQQKLIKCIIKRKPIFYTFGLTSATYIDLKRPLKILRFQLSTPFPLTFVNV